LEAGRDPPTPLASIPAEALRRKVISTAINGSALTPNWIASRDRPPIGILRDMRELDKAKA